MKTVGIITILKVNNYGAELQAFALQRKLQLLGYGAEIIDYYFYKTPGHQRERLSAPFYPYPLRKRLKECILPLWERIKSLPHRKAEQVRAQGFAAFHERNTKFSKQAYTKLSALQATPPAYDVYCVGSDQVWNPGCFTSLWPYFLTFAPVGKRRFSYASSFGVKRIPDAARAQYAEGLCALDAISVREATGVEIVRDVAQREAQNVLDPTLLLNAEEWSAVASGRKVPARPYILLYVLKETPFITQTALRLQQETGMRVVRICKGAFRQDSASSPIENILDAAPDDFLGLFQHASLVLTNSFHGTVFSILFHRDFYTIVRRGVENNSRQCDLLTSLGINRLLYADEAFSLAPAIDWEAVEARLQALREESIQFLQYAIGE